MGGLRLTAGINFHRNHIVPLVHLVARSFGDFITDVEPQLLLEEVVGPIPLIRMGHIQDRFDELHLQKFGYEGLNKFLLILVMAL